MPGDSSIQQDKELWEDMRDDMVRDMFAEENGEIGYHVSTGGEEVHFVPFFDNTWESMANTAADVAMRYIQARDKALEHKAHTDELWLLEHGANMAGEKFSVHKYLEIRRKELES